MTEPHYVPAATIRARFASAMSGMYRAEVPKYGVLLDMVRDINDKLLQKDPTLRSQLEASDNLQRLGDERHGAIRLGSAAELNTMRRLFAVMGMYPVGYYDLSVAGIPVHSTAFRPVSAAELRDNPFRIFTSLLRLDLITDQALRERAAGLLARRQIFSARTLELIDTHESQNGLDAQQADEFVREALHTFRWHEQATVNAATYQQFLASHRLIADIVCFKGPHINHLTPRTLDIDAVQQQMPARGLDAKAIVEGPPARRHPILLRQTSFKALDEPIEFIDVDGTQQGSHTARFGEIEQRGCALTPRGRRLYDRLLDRVRQRVSDPAIAADQYLGELEAEFAAFPDDLDVMRREGLAYVTFGANPNKTGNLHSLDEMVSGGVLSIHPITYEDFLPISAAGIFQSNLDQRETQAFARSPNQQTFERDLGSSVIDEFELYAGIQRRSLADALHTLGLDEDRRSGLLAQLGEA